MSRRCIIMSWSICTGEEDNLNCVGLGCMRRDRQDEKKVSTSRTTPLNRMGFIQSLRKIHTIDAFLEDSIGITLG